MGRQSTDSRQDERVRYHEALLAADDIERLREALTTAGYSATGIADRIGPVAVDAVRRNDFRALLRATGDGDRLATLVRVFLAGHPEPAGAVAAALAPLPLDRAVAAGLVERADTDQVRAGVDLDVHHDWWVLSDLDATVTASATLTATATATGTGTGTATAPAARRSLRPDHVLGVGNAAATLAGATIRRPIGAALDLGAGCGVQSLHLSGHAGSVTATDISDRALRFAATTAALNGQEWELVAGDLLDPVAGRRFDLVVSNPPFVVGPASTRYAYRDSGRPGDTVCAELAAAAPDVLTEGGTLQYLANWLHIAGEDWRERVGGWFVGTGCDAWAVQRDVSDPVDYVDLWLRDASEPADAARREAWLNWFDEVGATAVGFGVVTVRRGGREDPLVRVEELTQTVEPPLGEAIAAWFDRRDWLAGRLADGFAPLLSERLRRSPDLRLTQEADHDGSDWAVGRQILTQTGGLRWTEEVDAVALALVSGADGRTPVRDQLTVLAAAFDVPVATLAAAAGPVVAAMVERGFLLPPA
jgi:methylase of polypeptide subunit release factors